MDNITENQKDLIDSMNEFCTTKFNYTKETTKKEASEYIAKNIDEFRLLSADSFCLSKGY